MPKRSKKGIEKQKKKNNIRKRLKSDEYLQRKRQKKNEKDRERSEYQLQRGEMKKSIEGMIGKYEKAIRDGPTIVCSCCAGLYFPQSIQIWSKGMSSELMTIVRQVYTAEVIQLCRTCRRYVAQGLVPRLCLANGLAFPDLPDVLKGLTELEERLSSPRLPFMQIRPRGIDMQFGIKGNVVNIPIDVQKTIDVLPRAVTNSETIQLLLKRMRQHKSSYLNEYIRPTRVYEAVEYLVNQPLYIEEGIKLDFNWPAVHSSELEPFVADSDEKNIEENVEQHQDEDNWDETVGEEKVNPEGEQTLLKQGLVFAPGEGVCPLSLLTDDHVEELSFPCIYAGHKRELPTFLTYNDIVKSELRRNDRRAVKIPKIFFSLRKKEMLALRDAINICIRKRSQQSGLTAGQLLQSETIESLLSSDEAYKVLAGDRSSPAYWQQKMRELMAMVRQLGVPTFFLTLSAAETHWPELLVILEKVLHKRVITEKEALELSYVQKCELIQADPVTCARYFDHRFRELFKIITEEKGPFAEYPVVDSYCRIEFQHRGSPHVHCLLWLKDAPQYSADNPDSKKVCEDFIARFITCSTTIEATKGFVRYQYHKHTKTCRKFREDTAICRFGIPHYPMPRTMILDPIESGSLSDNQSEYLDTGLDRINDKLEEIDLHNRKKKEDENQMSFGEFLSELGMNEEMYVLAIRYSLKRTKIFLARNPNEIRTNGYNANILCRLRANMDLQFVLDPYSCVHYILNYINKSNRGMSTLLRSVVEECTTGYVSHQKKLQKICTAFMNCSEVSAQEAVYILLSMPLSISSRSPIFINTGEREKRTRVLKSERELKELDPDSNDIMVLGLLEYYALRPDELESLALADFAATYDYSRTKKWKTSSDSPNDDQIQTDGEQELCEEITSSADVPTVYKLKDGKGWIHRRNIAKVVRFRRFQFDKDESNFFREKCMLYFPWRDEESELIRTDCSMKFAEHRDVIEECERRYVENPSNDYLSLQEQIDAEQRAELAEQEDHVIEGEFAVYDLQQPSTNIGDEFGQTKTTSENNNSAGSFAGPRLLVDTKYLDLVRCLNYKQKRYLLGTMNIVKTSAEPFYHFVTGGAGTGKSVLISALYQSLIRWYAFKFPEECEKIQVLLLGPTGKSAFHIGGTTIHSGLGITVSQNSQLTGLSADRKSSLRNKFWKLKVIIIDEVSMVGAKTFRKIDHQLKQIFGSDRPFGGISIVTFGDFNQLRPVLDNYVFQSASMCDYSVLAGPQLWHLFRYYRLDELMRQRGDLSFAKALTHLATGEQDIEDISLMESRLFPKGSALLPVSAIRLFPTNAQVDSHNEDSIKRSPEIEIKSEARDYTTNQMSGRIREQALFRVRKLPTQQTYGLPKVVVLKIGIRYMITANIDLQDGLVNGTTGILRRIDLAVVDDIQVPRVLWIEYELDQIGQKARSLFPPRLIGDRALTPVEQVVRDINTKTTARIVSVSRRQFPLVPAEAITIHKAQGQTYDQVVVYAGKQHELAKMYTACSRARTSAGLFLTGDTLKLAPRRSVDHPIERELARLQSSAQLEFGLKYLRDLDLPAGATTVFYQNIQSLPSRRLDLECGPNSSSADLLALVETHTAGINIHGFGVLAQIAAGISRPHGIALFAKFGREQLFEGSIRGDVILPSDGHIEYLVFVFAGKTLMVVYCSPGCPKAEALHQLDLLVSELASSPRQLVLFGDFNIKLDSPNGQILEQILLRKGLVFIGERGVSTNNFGNQIDFVFSSVQMVGAFTGESLASDHKPILVVMQ